MISDFLKRQIYLYWNKTPLKYSLEKPQTSPDAIEADKIMADKFVPALIKVKDLTKVNLNFFFFFF